MTMELKKLFEVNEDLNEQMVNIILASIKDNHESGMDYLKFKQSIQNLMSMNMDEATSIKSAYATASTMGLTKESLSKSIINYLAVVNRERDRFIQTLKNQIDQNIDQPKEEILKYEEQIETNQRKIETLSKEIEAYKQKIESVKQEIEKSESKIEKTKSEFLAVYEAFVKNLEDDKSFYENNL
jgi:vacuolar-type H+-ATPase subunit I/STV1